MAACDDGESAWSHRAPLRTAEACRTPHRYTYKYNRHGQVYNINNNNNNWWLFSLFRFDNNYYKSLPIIYPSVIGTFLPVRYRSRYIHNDYVIVVRVENAVIGIHIISYYLHTDFPLQSNRLPIVVHVNLPYCAYTTLLLQLLLSVLELNRRTHT